MAVCKPVMLVVYCVVEYLRVLNAECDMILNTIKEHVVIWFCNVLCPITETKGYLRVQC